MNGVKAKALATVVPVTDSQSPHGEAVVILSTKAKDRDGDELYPDEWKRPLPDYITFDTDHGMSVPTTVGGGKPFINEKGQLQVGVGFSSLKNAQDTRTLVNEGIIRNVSVSYLERKGANGRPERELLGGSFVPIPANPEAVILSSKAAKNSHDPKEPYGPDAGYADPGYRNGVKRYPLKKNGKVDAERVRAAWDYFHHAHDRDMYAPDEQAHIESEIEDAAKEVGVHLSVASQNQKSPTDVITKASAPADAIGASNAYDELTGVQAVLRNVVTHLQNGNSPEDARSDPAHYQMIHDAACQLGGSLCENMAPAVAEAGQVWGANSPHIEASGKSAGLSQKSDAAAAPPATTAADSPAPTDDATALAIAKAKALAITISSHDE